RARGERVSSSAVSQEEPPALLDVEGHEVKVTNPSKPYFKAAGVTKPHVGRYYIRIADGALPGLRDRQTGLKRFRDRAGCEAFYQKRAPPTRPAFVRTVTLRFPSGRSAEEVVVDSAAGLAWIANLGCLELHPHPVRSRDLDHPDELRVDLDPGPGVVWADVRRVALEVRALLDELGLVGWPKTSGPPRMHLLLPTPPPP